MIKDNIIEILYRFMDIKGVGPVQTNKLILSLQKEGDISEIQIKNRVKDILNETQIIEFEKSEIKVYNVKSQFPVEFISLMDIRYPQDLKNCLKINTPPVLSFIGNLELLQKHKVAFSGSRKVSEKGIEITKDCTSQLVNQDVAILSGYAKGVDFTAHYTALKNGGCTIIILSEGINSFSIKKEFKEIWDWEKVLVLSEFRPSDIWMASRAMKRNNTIIGLSDVVVVIEAGETGGSLDAGEKTIQFGKHLFVPQYNIVPDSALGNNLLINKGAIPIKMNKDTSEANLSRMFSLFNTNNNYTLF
jgi:DNA processing protein